jgi:hypothetical protein
LNTLLLQVAAQVAVVAVVVVLEVTELLQD